MKNATLVLFLSLVPSVPVPAGAQQSPPCYFGECEPGPPSTRQTPPTRSPAPAPTPVPRTPAPHPAPVDPEQPRADRGVPGFFARNMCFRGNVAVPVNDGETCSRLYRDWGARRSDGSLVQCGILARLGGGGYTFRVISTQTVGECFDMREELGSSRPLGRCNKHFNAGYFHWRLDLTESECTNGTHLAIIVR